ncbi:MAG: phosphate regulon sensor protein PhoR [Halofilum sp. (in: g-proteobacteria)]|nr:phosphate regulon sensor protein PhoR [Halofilum sp. (in: g-proteobacteria)]
MLHWNAWKVELWRLAGAVLVALVVAAASGFWVLSFVGVLVLYIAWHLWQMRVVLRWLENGGSIAQAPESSGIWDELIHHVYRLQQRNRKRKKRLAAILDRFRRSTEALPDAAVVLGDNHEIEWSNRAAQVLLNVRASQDQGQRIDNLLRDPRFHAYLKAGDFEKAIDIPSPLDEDIELNVRVIPYGDGQHLLLARDVSTLRRLEAVRRDFVANVSHELRTPLTVIAGYVESFESEDLPPHVREGLEAVDRQSKRMLSIVQDLLMLSRLELEPTDPGAAEEIDMATLLAGLVDDARRVSGEQGHRIELDVEPGLGLRGVPGELSSAFGNLITNAVRHTPPGTRIDVVWRSRDDGGAGLSVRDDGPGIERRHLKRLTERFYRVDRAARASAAAPASACRWSSTRSPATAVRSRSSPRPARAVASAACSRPLAW